MSAMKLILGTMNFGPQVDLASSRQMVREFVNTGHVEIDSAYVYNGGDSERFLGEIIHESPSPENLLVATKVNPRVTGTLDAASIRTQLDESLSRLHCDSVDLLYLHFPDPATPIHETLKACAELHSEGKFNRLGLSNYAASEVVEICQLCNENNWPRPAVYQGLYNALSRNVEDELIPVLRKEGLQFYAYNPLAGGILTGKYQKFETEPAPGRFTVRPNYRDRYWKRSVFDALELLTKACQHAELAIANAAFRWMAHHSHLDASLGDGVLLGASSVVQLQNNLISCGQPCLPEDVRFAFDQAWNIVKEDSPSYFRTPDVKK